MTELSGTGQVVAGWAGGITVFIAILNVLWRMYGRTRVDGNRNVAESEFYKTLSEENKLLRERADEAFRQRNDAMLEIGSLREKVATLTARVLDQSVHIEKLERQVAALRDQIASLIGRRDFGPPLDPDTTPPA